MNEKNQTKPALRSSKARVTPWRVSLIRMRKTMPLLKGGGSLSRPGSTRNSTSRCRFWLQYSKISRVIRMETASSRATKCSNVPAPIRSVRSVPACWRNARNIRSDTVSARAPWASRSWSPSSCTCPGSRWYSEKYTNFGKRGASADATASETEPRGNSSRTCASRPACPSDGDGTAWSAATSSAIVRAPRRLSRSACGERAGADHRLDDLLLVGADRPAERVVVPLGDGDRLDPGGVAELLGHGGLVLVGERPHRGQHVGAPGGVALDGLLVLGQGAARILLDLVEVAVGGDDRVELVERLEERALARLVLADEGGHLAEGELGRVLDALVVLDPGRPEDHRPRSALVTSRSGPSASPGRCRWD